METPFFPGMRAHLAGFGRRADKVRQATLCQLEEFFGSIFPPHMLSQAEEGPNSRKRSFPIRRTFWGFLFQVLTPNTSCRAVTLQLRALLGLHSERQISTASSAYCQARSRLPVGRLEEGLQRSARAADQRSGQHGRLAGRPVKVVDATTVQLADTEANQLRYPQPSTQKRGCGFPVMKIAALFSLASGAILDVARENLHWHDLRLFRRLWSWLKKGDIVLGDRAFGDYVSLAQLPARGIDLVCRLHQGRKIDFRRCERRLGVRDAVFRWSKPLQRPKYLTKKQFARLPSSICVRVIRTQFTIPGFRTKSVTLVTTLLDAEKYPADELAALYLRRWRLELCFRDLKTTMGMEQLRGQSPAMVHKESLAFLIAHNLIRTVMADAAGIHDVPLERISFKGSVDAVRHFSAARAQARSRKQRRRLEDELLWGLARDRVPDRPGRCEPRAVKRRPKPYPLLTSPRRRYKEIPHRSRYRATKKPTV